MEQLHFTAAAGVATITIHRPLQRNAISQALWQEFPALCARIQADTTLRAVILRGSGREAFSAGGDISEFAAIRSNRVQADAYNLHVDAALTSIRSLSCVTIALIHGSCMGGGLMLAAACDLRLASSSARFAIPVARLGGLLTHTQLTLFTELIGTAHTTNLVLTARTVDAHDALQIGLCSQVVETDALDGMAADLASRITAFAPLTQSAHKQLLHAIAANGGLTSLRALESELADQVYNSRDYAEGTAAFVEKRAPHFMGQ